MYNENLKIKFIRENYASISTSKNCVSIFESFEKYEKEFGGDLSSMPEDVLSKAMDETSGARHRNWYTRMIVIRQYIKWCLSNNIPGTQKSAFLINEPGMQKIKKWMVSGPTHLQKSLDEVFADESEETIDCVYRAYYWLSFSGVNEDDIFRLKRSDIDFYNMEIHIGNRDYPVYKESIVALRNASELHSFLHYNKTHKSPIRLDRAVGDKLMRGTRSDLDCPYVRVVLSKKSKNAFELGKTNIKLSNNRVWLSGVFYRVYENERAGIGVDFSCIADDFMSGKEYKLDSGRNTLEAKKRQVMRDFENDYNRWKLAYQIF